MDFKQLKDIISNFADSQGLTDYEVFYMCEESLSTDTLKHEISAFSGNTSGGICFRCIVDGKMGYASSELLDEAEMPELVLRAMANAKCIENEDEVFIYQGSATYQKITAAPPKMLSSAEIKDMALALDGQLYARSDKVVDGTQASVLSFVSDIYLSNSHGLDLHNRVGVNGAVVEAVVQVDGISESSYEMCAGDSMTAFSTLPEKAVEDALSKVSARSVETGKYDVILSGKTMANLLSAFSGVFSARNAMLGLSLLAGKEGTKIASECVTITDDPLKEGCPMQTAFDAEGVATYKKNVVENGVLTTLLYDLTNAKKAGKTSTGNAQRGSYADSVGIRPFSFDLRPGELSLEELFAHMGDGLYITEVKGLHAGTDAVTGDFSVESAGYRIRDGKKAEAIKSFTVAGNFFELLQAIEAVSDHLRCGAPFSFTVFGSPDVYVKNMSVAGK